MWNPLASLLRLFFFFFLISKVLNAYRLIKASTRLQLLLSSFFFFPCRHTSAAAKWKTSSGKRGYENHDKSILFKHFTFWKLSTVTYQPIIFTDDVAKVLVKWRERGPPYWFQKVIKDKRRWLQEIAAKNRLLLLRRDESSSNFWEKEKACFSYVCSTLDTKCQSVY